ncbi:retrovirus-related pol polyprotein from transposon TNT 1-94 [Tanacetum coccineum]|uniref:Retrovirus-related pol polyprotein from transposon TNT 1-94 n=1 Tax=Tanacetum coccineum TaxID=301880 RepID=A0ABQ5EFL8_9ASTR
MSAEVDQNTVDKQCAKIERKNLLIANENLIANCLSNQLMFVVEQSRLFGKQQAKCAKFVVQWRPQGFPVKMYYYSAEQQDPIPKFIDPKIPDPPHSTVYKMQSKQSYHWYLDSGCLKHIESGSYQKAQEVLEKDSWFEAMLNEIHEFDRLKVWVLVPKPKDVMIIALKWIYKVKLDEYGDVLKNKARLYKGYRQEEDIDFWRIVAPVAQIGRHQRYSLPMQVNQKYDHQMDATQLSECDSLRRSPLSVNLKD